MSASVDVSGETLRTGKPRRLFAGPYRGGADGITIAGNTFADYDVSRDGRRFVMFPKSASKEEERIGLVTLATGWFDRVSLATRGR